MPVRSVWRCGTWSLLCCWALTLAAQQNPNGQVPVAGLSDAYLILIRDPLVQKELRLNDPQRRAVVAVTDELDATLWTLRNQSAEKAAAGYRDLIAKTEARMKPILSEAQQKRLNQLRLSAAGVQVLLRDDVASQLKLSRDQLGRIENVLKEAQIAAQEAARDPGSERTGSNRSKPQANGVAGRVAAILTRQQLVALRETLGPPVNGAQLGHVKFKAPELAEADGWINTEPLTMAQLKGKVVALHFWTFG